MFMFLLSQTAMFQPQWESFRQEQPRGDKSPKPRSCVLVDWENSFVKWGTL
jgi:hypothetical protein